MESQNIKEVEIQYPLDTGASVTIISQEVLQYIGFEPAAMQDIVEFGDASQDHIVPRVILPALSMGGVNVQNLEVLAYTLPEKYGIDGVLGLNFLRKFKRFTIDFESAHLGIEG